MKNSAFLDTQVLAYVAAGQLDRPVRDHQISSVVAAEYLTLNSRNPVQANYYVPMPRAVSQSYVTAGRGHESSIAQMRRRTHPFPKHVTDRVVMTFGADHPAVVQYSNHALTLAINNRLLDLYRSSVDFMPKSRRSLLLRRFRFMLDNSLGCAPISQRVVDHAFFLLSGFLRHYHPKANFRNSLNDMLILSTAQAYNAPLITLDKLLQRFAREELSARVQQLDKSLARINLPAIASPSRGRVSRDAKGYVNRTWKVRVEPVRARVAGAR